VSATRATRRAAGRGRGGAPSERRRSGRDEARTAEGRRAWPRGRAAAGRAAHSGQRAGSASHRAAGAARRACRRAVPAERVRRIMRTWLLAPGDGRSASHAQAPRERGPRPAGGSTDSDCKIETCARCSPPCVGIASRCADVDRVRVPPACALSVSLSPDVSSGSVAHDKPNHKVTQKRAIGNAEECT
jgi:hypothetical protein